jgi:hypothetical protein
MKKTIIFAGFMGIVLMGAANAADGIKVATDTLVNNNVYTVNESVRQLNVKADADKRIVDTNTDDVSSITDNRQTIPDNACDNLGSAYSGCGYIAIGGPGNGKDAENYQWIKIRNSDLTASE